VTVLHALDVSCSSAGCDYSSCVDGFDDCDSNRANGCESDLSSTTENCGYCGSNCNFDTSGVNRAFCNNSVCDFDVCLPGHIDCDHYRPSGCEYLEDGYYCGPSCTFCQATIQNAIPACVSHSVCSIGTCYTDYGDCDFNPANGCEADTRLPPTCGSSCTDCTIPARHVLGAQCYSGVCDYSYCQNNYGDCDGNRVNGCETPTTTVTHCGNCATACGVTEACVGGICM